MDQVLLLDFCVAIATALCVALLVYGVWLCLPELDGKPSKQAKGGQHESAETEAVVRQPRPRVRAGTGGR
jgi:hypothetical protein